MPPPSLGQAFLVGVDILKTTLTTAKSSVLAQVGDAVRGIVDANNVEWWQHVGFMSRPAKADAGKAACQGFVIRRGDRDVCIASRDVRGQEIVGNLDDGEACVYAPGAQGKTLYKADGSVTAMTTHNNAKTGTNVYAKVSPTEHRREAPWGREWFDGTGYHLRTWQGVKIDAYGVSLPAPFNVFGSTYRITADMIELNSACLVLGKDNNNRQPVALAPGVLAALAAVATAIDAIAVALAGVATTAAGSPVTGTALQVGTDAAGLAVAALNSALAVGLVPSTPITPNPLVIAGVTSVA